MQFVGCIGEYCYAASVAGAEGLGCAGVSEGSGSGEADGSDSGLGSGSVALYSSSFTARRANILAASARVIFDLGQHRTEK